MIVYGLLDYGYHSKVRDWSQARNFIDKIVGSKTVPSFMVPFNANASNKAFASAYCIRYAEHLLDLSPNSIKWSFTHGKQDIEKLEKTETGIWSPEYKAAAQVEVGLEMAPFSDQSSILLTVNLQELEGSVDFMDVTVNRYHKAYLLILVGCFMALGEREFFEAAAHPEMIEPGFNEFMLYKTIMKSTKLRSLNNKGKRVGSVSNRIHAGVYDISGPLAESYHAFTEAHPNLQVDDVKSLISGVSRFTRNMRLVP